MGLLNRVDSLSTRLSNYRAFVVGGSGGVGRAVSYALAEHGAAIVCHGGHDRSKLEQVVAYIRRSGGRAAALPALISKAEDIVPSLDEAGRVDILVVAMGPVWYGALEETDAETWRGLVETNLLLPGILVSHYLPRMVERGWGRIVLFGAPHGDGVRGFREISAYAAAKAGVASLCKSAALQTKGANVTVNMIAPGYVDTEYLSDSERSRMRSRSPRNALIPPERIARTITHLVSSEEADINGAIITVDQGLS
jgi:3-oxoacyl-[acyl-carrier protein] reductase